MPVHDLRGFIATLEERDLLRRVRKEVDWHLEVGTVMHEVHQRHGPAILFENVKDSDYPLLCGALGTLERYALALGMPNDPRAMQAQVMEALRQPLPPVALGSGPCQENVLQGSDIDLERFPSPFWHPLDGGRFIGTLGVVIVEDPDTGQRNAALYREQVLGRDKTGVLLGRHGSVVLQKYLARGEPMPIATCFGVDPTVLMSAIMPFNYGEDELGMAGALRGEPVPMVRGKTVDLLVPASAEFIFEGYISPDRAEWLDEGPFGEYTGYYGGELSKKPTVQLTAITHRDNPIMQGTLEGPAPNESDVLITVGGSAALKSNLMQMGVPGIKDVWLRGRSFIAAVSLEREYYSGHGRQVIDAGLATNWGFKWLVVVNADIDVFNWEEVDWALSTRVQPHRDIVITDNWHRGSSLDPSIAPKWRISPTNNRSSKIGIDATTGHKGFEWAPAVQPDAAMLRQVREQWDAYGIDAKVRTPV
jgi:4-hydroxy-3-polyprenylbenzoate decarboxylase